MMTTQETELLAVAQRIESLLVDACHLLRIISQRTPQESKQCQAIRLLADFGPDNMTEIAKAVGVSRQTLYTWATFVEARERMRAAAQWAKRAPRCVRPSGELFDEVEAA